MDLIQPDRIGVQMRLRDPDYIDKDGRIVVDSEALEWSVIWLVPTSQCGTCFHDEDRANEMCRICMESWSWDWIGNEETIDTELIKWMMRRDF